MAGPSEIEWTDATWNPIVGCQMVSPGCTNCYAMRMAARLQSMGLVPYRGITRKSAGRYVWTGRVRVNESVLDAPLRWKKPKKIFVNSMSDLFQEGVDWPVLVRVWDVMARAPQHIFQVLTKRPDRMRRFVLEHSLGAAPNIWLGTSVESRGHIERIELLRMTPAQTRFISFEPLIGSVGKVDLRGVDWAIVGGESGPNSRPIRETWVDEIHRECREQGVAFFFKQWGGTNKRAAGRRYRGRTWDEYPDAAAAGL